MRTLERRPRSQSKPMIKCVLCVSPVSPHHNPTHHFHSLHTYASHHSPIPPHHFHPHPLPLDARWMTLRPSITTTSTRSPSSAVTSATWT